MSSSSIRPPLSLFPVVLIALALGFTPHGEAQTYEPPAGAEAAALTTDRVAFDDQGGMTLRAFVDWAGRTLDKPILLAPAAQLRLKDQTESIRFSRKLTMKHVDVMQFVLKTLFTHQLTLVDLSTKGTPYLLLENLDTPTVLRSYRRHVTEKELETLRDMYVMVSCVMQLKNADVYRIQGQAQRLCPQATPVGHSIIPLPGQNQFVLIGFAPEVYRWRRVIRDMDVAPKPGAVSPAGSLVSSPTVERLTKEIERLSARLAKLEKALAARSTPPAPPPPKRDEQR